MRTKADILPAPFGSADDIAGGDPALDLWDRCFSQFIGKTCRHPFRPNNHIPSVGRAHEARSGTPAKSPVLGEPPIAAGKVSFANRTIKEAL
jgi:hypothetical protein